MELPIEMRSYIVPDVTNDEKSSMAEKATLLSELTRKEIELIAEHMHVCEAGKGTAILKEGERGGYLCVLISGRMDVYKESGSGQSRKISTVRPGRAIGEMSLIDGQAYSATVLATEPVRLLVLAQSDFINVSRRYPRLGLKLLWRISRLVSLRLRQTSAVLTEHLEA